MRSEYDYAIIMKGFIKTGMMSKDKFIESYNNKFKDDEDLDEYLKSKLLEEPLEWYLEQ